MRMKLSDTILESISQELLESLTDRQLELVVQALNLHWHKAQDAKEQAIIAQGCIWSARHGQFLNLSYKTANGTIKYL
jgi:hypothetical protein